MFRKFPVALSGRREELDYDDIQLMACILYIGKCVWGGASFRSGPEKGDKLQIRTGNWGGQLSKLTSKNIIWLIFSDIFYPYIELMLCSFMQCTMFLPPPFLDKKLEKDLFVAW
jgi:hypothetical protein